MLVDLFICFYCYSFPILNHKNKDNINLFKRKPQLAMLAL